MGWCNPKSSAFAAAEQQIGGMMSQELSVMVCLVPVVASYYILIESQEKEVKVE